MWIELHGIKLKGLHGVGLDERILGNDFEIDVRIQIDDARVSGDCLETTVDYETVFQVVKSVFHGKSVHLIEILAERIELKLLEIFSYLLSLEIHIRKMNPPISGAATFAQVSRVWNK